MFLADCSTFGAPMPLGSDESARAVVRHPPPHFILEFLPPSASKGSCNHGLHITPPMTRDSASVSRRGPIIGYDIWRSWGDCLWFQEALEQEYSRAAREKKVRLKQGKGVKAFNGMYKQDMASSWDSLPPGPDPKSVAQDIHGHLPRLTKKGTVFRASQTAVEQRHREFRNLVEALFSDEMPALIQEIRASNVVTGFFGLWRRDFDRLDRSPNVARSTITSSLFSSYFSESTPSLFGRSSISSGFSPKSLLSSPSKKSRSNRSSSESRALYSARSPSRSHSTSTSTDLSKVSRYPASSECSGGGIGNCTDITYRSRPRPPSIALSNSSSTTDSDITSDFGSTGSTNLAIADDTPYPFGHKPQHANERLSSVLAALPEEREMLLKGFLAAPTVPRPKASMIARKANRSFQIVGSPGISDSGKLEKPLDERSIRESWQTFSSMGSNTNEIVEGLDFTLPNSVKENKFRASMASISTFMTTDSAEAVIPRTLSPNDRRSTPSLRVSLRDFEIYSDYDHDSNSIFDDSPRPTSHIPEYSSNRPETPTGHEYSDAPRSSDSMRTSLDTPPSPALTSNSFLTTPNSPYLLRTSFDRPSSPTCSIGTAHTVSTVTSSVAPGSLSLKAAYNDAIILVRLPRETSFAEVRERLYNKVVGQEGVPLSHDFTVALVPAMQSPIQLSPPKDRLCSMSTSSADRTDLILINCGAHWEHLISSAVGSKLSLQILDPK